MKIFVAGAASSMAQPFLRLLESNPLCTGIVGIDVRAPSTKVSKLVFHERDIRDPDLENLIRGCDVLVNFAFVVAERRDKSDTHDINVNGSKNVYRCAVRAQVRKILCVSSILVYGVHPDHPIPIDEGCALRGNDPDVFYYSWAKREVELFLNELGAAHPEITVTRLRPGVVVGPDANPLLDRVLGLPFLPVFLGKNFPLSFVHEKDVLSALHLALTRDHPGAFNIVADPPLAAREIASLAGKVALPIPWSLACRMADFQFAHALGLLPGSSQSLKLFEYPLVASNRKAREVMGWTPEHAPAEAFRAFAEKGWRRETRWSR